MKTAAVLVLWSTAFTAARGAPAAENPKSQPATKPACIATGKASPSLKSFDDLMISFLRRHKAVGGALAVARNGRLVYARGFGYADRSAKRPVQPDSLFRIASISKPITAAAVLQLVERKKLKLTDRVFDVLKFTPHLPGKAEADPRLGKITIAQLLQHTAGWDSKKSPDPMFRSVRIAEALKTPPPAGPVHVVRYMMGRPLDFEPGTRHAYSNFGYCLLGRVIEARTPLTYEQYVRRSVLAPLGITRMRIGRTLAEHRGPGEVRYYDSRGGRGRSVFAKSRGRMVPRPYGAWCLESMDAHGGWIASAVDLVRFACAFDGSAPRRILAPRSVAAMFARPTGPAGYDAKSKPKAAYYARGWMVRPVGRKGQANTWHAGGLPGTSTLLVRRHDGLNWAVLFNSDRSPTGKRLAAEIDPLVHRAAAAVKDWPKYDLFGEFSGKE